MPAGRRQEPRRWLLPSKPSRSRSRAAGVALGVAYSLPPFRLSGRPVFSLLVWPLVAAAFYASAALVAGRWWTPASLLYLGGVLLFYAVGEILAKDIRDWDNDAATG